MTMRITFNRRTGMVTVRHWSGKGYYRTQVRESHHKDSAVGSYYLRRLGVMPS